MNSNAGQVSRYQIAEVYAEAFEGLKIDVTIKLQHRRILDGMFAVAGVSDDKISTAYQLGRG